MKLLTHATDASYRQAIADENNAGRFPPSRIMWGLVTGLGWGFLGPWSQQALFPAKGTPAGVGHPDRYHEAFILVRLFSHRGSHQHPNVAWAIEGRYWRALVWRASWGKIFGIPRFRYRLVDPDIVTYDPQKADDWGDRPGESW